MSRLKQLYIEFEGEHQSLKNRSIHYLGISTMSIGLLGALHHFGIGSTSLAVLLLLGTLLLDLITWPKIAGPVFMAGILFLGIGSQMSLIVNITVAALGLFIQASSHRIFEKNQPAFLKNLIHSHIGPRWMLAKWLHFFGFNCGFSNHLDIKPDLSDGLRWCIAKLIPSLSRLSQKTLRKKFQNYSSQQEKLKRSYGLDQQPIQRYSEILRGSIIQRQQDLSDGVFAYTSGSTSRPKQILYTKERLRLFKKSSMNSSLQSFDLLKVENPAMFIFASLKKDDSFASLVVNSKKEGPGFIEGLIEPAKYLSHPLIQPLMSEYGANGLRLWIITMTSPGALYATNPSTLAVFLDDISQNWWSYRQMFRDFVNASGGFSRIKDQPGWTRLIYRMSRGNFAKRVLHLAELESFQNFSDFAPDLKGYICWNGGYVRGFLKKVYRVLPPEHYIHIPMFSMSTETMQTELYLENGKLFFTPTGDQVVYEFIEEGETDEIGHLQGASELEVGKSYTMIVSDPWGLARYQTQDIFLCQDKIRGMPDLRFQKRRGLAYSFTGEKITGEQVEEAVNSMQDADDSLNQQSMQFILIPSQPDSGIPHYILLGAMIGTSKTQDSLDPQIVALQFEKALFAINQEYKDKRESDRLAPISCKIWSYDKVARCLDPKTSEVKDINHRSWESQFKLTPITTKLWQDIISEETNE